jgi:1-deoxy-D-xylulose-5-phosphate reductoisomerase
MQQLAILGSTGSIGTQTLDVVRRNPDRYRVAWLTTNQNVELLDEQIREFRPDGIVLSDPAAAALARQRFASDVQVFEGLDAACEIVARNDVDIVMSAMVGAAGLAPTVAAVSAGKRVALANKETMVVAGQLINQLVHTHGATLIPVDSEHSAIFQCLVGERPEAVEQIILTASGGPFRELDGAAFGDITPEQALRHPNWDMGPKITIDSATMINKGLEVIEARWLFDVEPERLSVVIHPQSIVHSMVQFIDGSVMAQLGLPDMRLPIQYALAWPERLENDHDRLNLPKLGTLSFFEPDLERFPALRLAYEALEVGGTAPAVLNAANEIAVRAFLDRDIGFQDIPRLIERALKNVEIAQDLTIEAVFDADKRTREAVRSYLGIPSTAS